ncbi:MAG: hypothetical protein ACKVH8_22750 [Pirellulales bacterium]
MTENPYQSSTVDLPPVKKTPVSRKLIWVGSILLVLAGLCILATVIGLVWWESAILDSDTPQASDLASAISRALIPLYFFWPLAIIGFTLLMIGIGTRRRDRK